MIGRRGLLLAGAALVVAGRPRGAWAARADVGDEEWKSRLTPAQYDVLRRAKMERAGSSPLVHERRRGTYCCAACGEPLFRSEAKIDSRSGWPSFRTSSASGVFTKGSKLHCAGCNGHLGRRESGANAINGVALRFRAA